MKYYSFHRQECNMSCLVKTRASVIKHRGLGYLGPVWLQKVFYKYFVDLGNEMQSYQSKIF
jgi:hypothetical protein